MHSCLFPHTPADVQHETVEEEEKQAWGKTDPGQKLRNEIDRFFPVHLEKNKNWGEQELNLFHGKMFWSGEKVHCGYEEKHFQI